MPSGFLYFRLKPLLSIVLLIISSATLHGCNMGGKAPAPIPRELNFKRFQHILMNVSKIDVIEEYQSPKRKPYVEHLLPITPAEAMQKWVEDRLRVSGTEKSMQVIITDASVTSTQASPPQGVQGLVSTTPNRRYDAKLTVEMRIYGQSAMSEASIQVTATRRIYLNEGASVNERHKAFHRMTFDLMETMNAALEKHMFLYLGDHIVF